MLELKVHDRRGLQTGAVCVAPDVAAADEAGRRLLHTVFVAYRANRRLGTVKTKTRAEVSGSSKKLYKQKGTGNARAGNKRTPVRRGGGHCFAKSPTDWSKLVNKKARRVATGVALRAKLASGRVCVVDDLRMDAPKTSEVFRMLKGLGVAGRSVLIGTESHDSVFWKSSRNIPQLSVIPVAELNAEHLLQSAWFVTSVSAFEALKAAYVG